MLLYWQSPKVSHFLIPTDFEANLPRSPVARGLWLLKNVFLMRLNPGLELGGGLLAK